MKILLVITKSEIGGAQMFVLSLARGLKAAGEEVVVAGGPGDYLPAELAREGIAFHRLQKLERSHNPLKGLGFIAELKAYVSAEKFDVVHLNSTNALLGVWGLAGLNPKPRVIFTVHGLSLLDSGHKASRLMKSLYMIFFRAAFKKLDKLVFVSRLNQESAAASGLLTGGLESKSELIYNGLDFAPGYLLGREEARREIAEIMKLSGEEAASFQKGYIYGSIGRLAYPKNYEFLVNTYKAAKATEPSAKLLIIGEGPERGKYEGLVKSYKLENDVYLAGEITNAGRYLRAFDLFVLPSVFEGLSLSLIEAIRAEVPAIASRVGGNEEIVGKEWCFELNNQDDFMRLFSIIRGNMAIGQGKDEFSADAMVKSYLDVYNG